MGQLLSSILSSQHQSQPQSLGEDSRSSLNNDHKLIAAALRTNQIDKIKSCLLLSNTNLNFVFSQTEMCSPIQYAARYCSREVVELLIDRGARGNVDSLGMNPLHYAIARFGNVFESYEDIGAYSVEFVEAFHVFRVICERNLCPVDEQDSVIYLFIFLKIDVG
jgi:ankyrin repeat protein